MALAALIIVQRASSDALLLAGLERLSDFNPEMAANKGCRSCWLLKGKAECHSQFMALPGNGNVLYEACKPVLRQSVPFCLKELDFFLFK